MIEKMQRKIVLEKGVKAVLFLLLSAFLFLGPTGGVDTIQVIRAGEEGDREFLAMLVYLVMAVCDGIFIYQFIQALRGDFLRPFQKWCQAQKNPEKAKEELNLLYEHTAEHFGFRINDKIVMYTQKGTSFIANKDDIIWIYSSASRPYTGNMQPGKGCTIHFHYSTLAPEDVVEIEGGDEMGKRVIAYLQSAIPDAVFGYSDDLESMYEVTKEPFPKHIFEK